MVEGSHDCLSAGFTHAECDLITVGGDDDAVGDAKGGDALEDANDNGDAREEAEGFSGETRGAQTCWDNGKSLHANRPESATFTPRKIGSAWVAR